MQCPSKNGTSTRLWFRAPAVSRRFRGGLVPYRLVDAAGAEAAAVSEFLRNLTASDCSPRTVRSYAFELLGWLRFLDAVDVAWDRASRAEARDYALWLARARKPPRQRRRDSPPPGSVNPVTGKTTPGENYAARDPGGTLAGSDPGVL